MKKNLVIGVREMNEFYMSAIKEVSNIGVGNAVTSLSKESAKKIIQIALGAASEEEEFTEMEQSVVSELGNIMAGSYLRSLADFLNPDFFTSPPASTPTRWKKYFKKLSS
jgi:chemotaxis protein CheY-P-specific phosphatase CheC